MSHLPPKIFLMLAIFSMAACSTNLTNSRVDLTYPTYADPSGVMTKFDRERMFNNCRSMGGLNEQSIFQRSNQVWSYRCNNRPIVIPKGFSKDQPYIYQDLTEGLSNPLRISEPTKPASTNTTDTLSEAKKKCADLGFKAATEDFGKCVLQLSK
jgi:hypothetical protein